jgi:hypothetical protein
LRGDTPGLHRSGAKHSAQAALLRPQHAYSFV